MYEEFKFISLKEMNWVYTSELVKLSIFEHLHFSSHDIIKLAPNFPEFKYIIIQPKFLKMQPKNLKLFLPE